MRPCIWDDATEVFSDLLFLVVGCACFVLALYGLVSFSVRLARWFA